jgi:hypothetical protein
VLGNVNVPDFGNASAALFNGTAFQPFILTSREDGSQGSIGQMFVRYVPFSPSHFHKHKTHY